MKNLIIALAFCFLTCCVDKDNDTGSDTAADTAEVGDTGASESQ
jgi:hypothetical protein